MPIDAHAHYVPRRILETLEDRAADYGLSLVKEPPSCAVHFDHGLRVRPFFPQLIEEVGRRLDGMGKQGVDRQVLSLWADIFGYGLPPEPRARWHRLLNESLSQHCARHPRSFSMLASVPLPDAAASAREVEVAATSLGAVGIVVAANVEGVNLGEVNLDEFWHAAVQFDLPVFIHPTQPVPTSRTAKFGLNQTVQYTFDTTLCVGSLIEGGVLDRFPTLRLLLSHGGGGFPYLLGRFDCMHARMASGHHHEATSASPPSDYRRRFYYDTLLHDAGALRFLADVVSVDRLVLGSDYSFPPADRDPVASVRAAGFGDAVLARILEQNPRELFPRLAKQGGAGTSGNLS